MDSETKAITGVFVVIIVAVMAVILAFVATDYSKDARAINAGYQECQKLGSNGTVWQQECVFSIPGGE